MQVGSGLRPEFGPRQSSITYCAGDIFATSAAAIVNPVNCVGVMGAGIALGVRQRWPQVYEKYHIACGVGRDCSGQPDGRYGPRRAQQAPPCCVPGQTCDVHRVRPGGVIVRRTNEPVIRYVIDFPTKRHWRDAALLDDVLAGFEPLTRAIAALSIATIAVPMLGCGNGGLN